MHTSPKELLRQISEKIKPFSRKAEIEAEMILGILLNLSSIKIYLNDPIKVSQKQLAKIKSIVKLRKKHYPLQYALGNINFMGLILGVTPTVMIPRQETEILVDICLKKLTGWPDQLFGLDIGTGSGNIAIALVDFLKNLNMVATDISKKALKLARKNSRRLEVGRKIRFIQSDLFRAFKKEKFDFIISNPPYVTRSQLKKVAREVKFEPKIALDGGADGLKIIKRILAAAPDFLKPDGFLILEIGAGQKKKIKQFAEKMKKFAKISFYKDYAGWERVVVCEK